MIFKNVIIVIICSFGVHVYSQVDSCACCTSDHRDFDFWIGEWEVMANGKVAGMNVIKKQQKGCVLRENWISARAGYTGTSYNFFNIHTQQWEQIWIDNQGKSLHLKGGRSGNQMILISDEYSNDEGQILRNRITWTANPDNSVRQLWEVLEGEKVISISFDGLYTQLDNN